MFSSVYRALPELDGAAGASSEPAEAFRAHRPRARPARKAGRQSEVARRGNMAILP